MLAQFTDVRVVVVAPSPEAATLEALLHRAGVRHAVNRTDRQLLEEFHRFEPDLVVVDLQTPGVDALELVTQVTQRAAGAYLPVLVISGPNLAAARRALSAGARDYVTKPLNAVEVLLRAGNLLETRGLYQELRRAHTTLAAELDCSRRQANAEPDVQRTKHDLILAALAARSFEMVFQPVVDITTGTTVGREALARFEAEPERRPDEWFADASDVGLGYALELAAANQAVEALPRLDDGFLSVNVSPETLLHPNLLAIADSEVAPRLVVELTEHQPVEDYGPVVEALARLRDRGVRVAVDDTGAGFAGMRHLVTLEPDIIKLDMTLVRDIDQDPVRRALVTAMVAFSAETGSRLLAEGVESGAELDTLRALGVPWAQGYLLGEPRAMTDRRRVSVV